MKTKMVQDYFFSTQIKVMNKKKRKIRQLEKKSHVQQIVALQNIDENKDFYFLIETLGLTHRRDMADDDN